MESAPWSSDDSAWINGFSQLAHITDPAWLNAARAATQLAFPARTKIIHHGRHDDRFLLLLSGCVRVYKVSETGQEIVLYRVRAGEVCVLNLLTQLAGPFVYKAEAITETTVQAVSISSDDFNRALAQSEAFRRFVFTIVAERMNGIMLLLEDVAFKRLELRLAQLLLHCADKLRYPPLRATRNSKGACLRTSHYELATELGSAREAVSRVLKGFERKGWLKLGRRKITILAPEALASLSSARHATDDVLLTSMQPAC